ncbi:hypothetical protein LINGRAHAP2_LOCUS14101 [Linum grandiflorum]
MLIFAATIIVERSDQKIELPKKDTMHVGNALTMDLIVHCGSGDDDLGAHIVPVKSEFSWSFTGYGNTLFWCHVAVQDKRAEFVAFNGRGYCPLHWFVDDAGVHANETGCDASLYPWA